MRLTSFSGLFAGPPNRPALFPETGGRLLGKRVEWSATARADGDNGRGDAAHSALSTSPIGRGESERQGAGRAERVAFTHSAICCEMMRYVVAEDIACGWNVGKYGLEL